MLEFAAEPLGDYAADRLWCGTRAFEAGWLAEQRGDPLDAEKLERRRAVAWPEALDAVAGDLRKLQASIIQNLDRTAPPPSDVELAHDLDLAVGELLARTHAAQDRSDVDAHGLLGRPRRARGKPRRRAYVEARRHLQPLLDVVGQDNLAAAILEAPEWSPPLCIELARDARARLERDQQVTHDDVIDAFGKRLRSRLS